MSQDPTPTRAPIAVALDAADLATIRSWTRSVAPFVSTVKIGLEAYCRDGALAVSTAREAAENVGFADIGLFLDLKLHDIPATVAGAARAVAPLRPDYLTVHAAGGPAMIEAAASALDQTRIAAVTVLTSVDDEVLARVGIIGPSLDAAVRLAELAVSSGARAIVCSPLEVAASRAAVPSDIVLITPGVRPAGSDLGDQVRIATPAAALAAGADLLVIGRPITSAPDPSAAAREIAADLHGVRSRQAPLVVVSGPSGVGKSTVVAEALRRAPDAWLSVSVTTRPPRPGERDGVDYWFVDEQAFERMARSGELLEHAQYAGHRYGTPRDPVQSRRAAGVPVLLEIEVQGARQVRQSQPDCRLVFLAPPSWEELAARLRGRGTESDDAVRRRLDVARGELAASNEFDDVVVNVDVGASADALVGFLHEHGAP
ncbi:MAG: orotidine-5'-phosphate decarboxylase [Actinomycetales bacterium]